ncbi:Carbohydrate-responsive element-binding protein [Armadillidium nasatum]|uniref:Carbohydrate-responsive element-binding protein n=1 Tax=Armadillidium nasatum TaxID=96803 RepID=A0A5N5TKB3_9CRUS|nr:Carbohydrate-responsive element-binding protein [Armadillidium nasatum]
MIVNRIPSVQANMLGSNALVFPAPSYSNQELNLHSDKNRAQVSPIGHVSAPLPLTNVVHVSAETDQSAPSDSNFLSHILSTADSCAPSVPHSPQSHTTKIKVARITPRPYPEIASSTSSSSKTNSKAIFRPTAAGSSALSVSNSNPQPQLLPNVTLSAVTPSSIKSIPPSVVSAQASNWPPGNIKNIKTSPPYPEPNSPTTTHSISSSPPTKPFRPKSDAERVQYKEHRRVCHINAEQKRRCNIKNNFEMLHSLIPSVNQNPNAKVSKATMLHKGAEYILQMKQERQQLAEQAEQLRNQIETLSTEISLAQSMLPATGAGMRPTRHNKIKEKFDSYIREQTLANPKYYVLALIAQPLLQSYNSSVSTASVDDLCRSSMAWLDQHCSLNVLRPVVSNAMRKLSVTTNILTTPETLYEDIFKQVAKQESGVKFSSAGFSPSEQR